MEKLLTFKDLENLAKACRKTGIQSFKGFGVEFTLSDNAPAPAKPRGKQKAQSSNLPTQDNNFESDSLSESDLLYWSTGLTDPGASGETSS